MIEIRKFPMAPSANRLQINIPSGRGRCRKNSDEYLSFLHEVKIFELSNRRVLKQAAEELKDRILSVRLDFYFTKDKVYCKDGRIKALDHHNRLKATLDALAGVLQIDDRMFFEVSCVKKVAEVNYTDIEILEF